MDDYIEYIKKIFGDDNGNKQIDFLSETALKQVYLNILIIIDFLKKTSEVYDIKFNILTAYFKQSRLQPNYKPTDRSYCINHMYTPAYDFRDDKVKKEMQYIERIKPFLPKVPSIPEKHDDTKFDNLYLYQDTLLEKLHTSYSEYLDLLKEVDDKEKKYSSQLKDLEIKIYECYKSYHSSENCIQCIAALETKKPYYRSKNYYIENYEIESDYDRAYWDYSHPNHRPCDM
jgi:hypothetical protein